MKIDDAVLNSPADQKNANLDDVIFEHLGGVDKVLRTLFLMDGSSSMGSLYKTQSGEQITRIEGASRGLQAAADLCREDAYMLNAMEFCVVPFTTRAHSTSFVSLAQFSPPVLEANGGTDMGPGLCLALDEMKKRTNELDDAGQSFAIPRLVILSDGATVVSKELTSGIARVSALVSAAELRVSLIGVTTEDTQRLEMLGIVGDTYCVEKMEWENAFESATLQHGLGSK